MKIRFIANICTPCSPPQVVIKEVNPDLERFWEQVSCCPNPKHNGGLLCTSL